MVEFKRHFLIVLRKYKSSLRTLCGSVLFTFLLNFSPNVFANSELGEWFVSLKTPVDSFETQNGNFEAEKFDPKKLKNARDDIWYRVEISKNNIPQMNELGIDLGRIGDSDRSYWNGILIGSTGLKGNEGNFLPHLRRIYPIGNLVEENNVLVVHAKKLALDSLGVGADPSKVKFGNIKDLKSEATIDYGFRTLLPLILGISLILFGLYFLFIYGFLRQFKDYRDFGICLINFGLFGCCVSFWPYEIGLNPNWVMYVHAISSIWAFFFFAKYFLGTDKNGKRTFHLVHAILATGFSIFVLMGHNLEEIINNYLYWYSLFIPAVLGVFIAAIFNKGNSRTQTTALIISLGLMILALFHDVLVTLGFVQGDLLGIPVFLFILFGSVFLIGKDFAYAYTNVENQVRDRTKDLQSAIEQLKSLEKLKEKFFSNISHDLKTPVTIIQGAISKLRDKFTSENSLLEPIETNTNKLSKMISNILMDTKLKEGRIELQLKKVQLKSFFDQLNPNYQILADQENIRWEYKNEYTDEIAVFDPEYLERVVDNIVSNAIKYTKTSPKNDKIIAFRVWESNQSFNFSVEDSGIGIPKNEQEKVFERFSQSSRTDLKIHGGFGIGLSFVKEIVEKHNGLVSLSESKWGGVHIMCMIPTNIQASEKVPVFESSKQILPPIFHSKEIQIPAHEYDRSNLLICEDNHEIAKMLISSFEGIYNIFYAENGRIGLDIISKNRIDCILCDYIMPEMDGAELLRLIKKDKVFSQIPFLFLTSQSDEALIENMIESGATDYITKPFVSGILKARVYRAIEAVNQRDKIEKEKKYTTLGLMSAGISHELKNPIHAMINYLNILQSRFSEFEVDGKNSDQFYDQFRELKRSIIDPSLGFLKQSTDRMGHLVENVNIFSTSSGKSKISNLNQIVDTCISALSHKANSKGIKIISNVDHNIQIEILPSIQQAIINIIDNAIDAVDENIGQIEINWMDKDNFGILEIKDNGSGIPEPIRRHIFDMFMTTKINKRGSGFGLYITKNIIEFEHNGKIWVEDNQPSGSIFLCKLWKNLPKMEDKAKEIIFNTSKSIQ